MQIIVNTDSSVRGSDELTAHIEGIVEHALRRYATRVTRVEVHLNDESGTAKVREDDMRCVMEARLAGLQPISVRHDATSAPDAVTGAAEKMEKLLQRRLERMSEGKGRTSAAGDQTL